MLTDDPTDAAVLAAVPCYPVPPSGRSPAIDALRTARGGHGIAIGCDNVMLILRRPWLALDVPITASIAAYLALWRCRTAEGRPALRAHPT